MSDPIVITSVPEEKQNFWTRHKAQVAKVAVIVTATAGATYALVRKSSACSCPEDTTDETVVQTTTV